MVFFHSDVQSTESPSTTIEAGNMTLIFVATSIGVVIVALVVVIAALVYRQRRHGTHQINAGKQRKGKIMILLNFIVESLHSAFCFPLSTPLIKRMCKLEYTDKDIFPSISLPSH